MYINTICHACDLYIFSSGTPGLDSVIQRNDTSKSSTAPEVVYPMRSAESHGAASNAAVDRKTVPGSVSSAAAAGGTAIGQSLFYTDFPPKEYGHSAGRWSRNNLGTYIITTQCTSQYIPICPEFAGSLSFVIRHTIVHSLLVPLLLYCYWENTNVLNKVHVQYMQ